MKKQAIDYDITAITTKNYIYIYISTAPHLISPGAQQAFIKAAFDECSQRIGLAYVDMTKVTSHHLC